MDSVHFPGLSIDPQSETEPLVSAQRRIIESDWHTMVQISAGTTYQRLITGFTEHSHIVGTLHKCTDSPHGLRNPGSLEGYGYMLPKVPQTLVETILLWSVSTVHA